MEKTKVYFTKEITPESLVNIYKHLGIELKGNVAVKLHSGEDGNQNYVKPEFVKDIIDMLVVLLLNVIQHMVALEMKQKSIKN